MGESMLTLGSKARYGDRECIIVARTIEHHARYDLLFPDTRRIQQYVPEDSLAPIAPAPRREA
jgi:hypothetical protein